MKALALAVLLAAPAAAASPAAAPAEKESALRALHERQAEGLRNLRRLVAEDKSDREIKRELASLRTIMEEIRRLEPDGTRLKPVKPAEAAGEVPGDEEERE